MMNIYRKEEMISSSEVAKNFGFVLSEIGSKNLEKVCVLKNNKPQAIIVSVENYEKLLKRSMREAKGKKNLPKGTPLPKDELSEEMMEALSAV